VVLVLLEPTPRALLRPHVPPVLQESIVVLAQLLVLLVLLVTMLVVPSLVLVQHV